ncbi:HipA family kinase [Bacillus taeanensis]|uniref:HipA-like kinase domain-containing protein n=1 Tax=Bacillus taeanensis TaxID=273032 RepID=A0A366XTB1_9BACI|nr:HipA family kinase [Bacillus taeanensis]RBW68788.1 hypothetical protein DS031_14675 [Bacillus taeanensis]
MTKSLKPVQFIRSLDGKSKPQLLLFNDSLTYVVKFKNNRQGTRVLVNEYVVGRLAQLLSLPAAPFKVVSISQEFIKTSSEKTAKKFKAGNQFASVFIPNCTGLSRVPPRPLREEIENIENIAGMVVFDHWVNNTDRGSNNILLEPLPNRKYDLHLIDHANCFPNEFKWTEETVKENPNQVVHRTVHKWAASLLTAKELQPYVEKIIALSNQSIYKVIQSIPNDWEVSPSEKAALFAYLVDAKNVLPHLIEKFTRKYM